MAQQFIDLYPDFINQFGLIGCGLFTAWILTVLTSLWTVWSIR
jgi:hypothetical protein